MARKPTISLEDLEALGAKKLAALVFEETAGSAAFKRRVSAALAGKSGSEAIAKLIDRRLAGLERARAFIDWDKTQAFRDDLAALLGGIVQELGPADPEAGLDRLLRFLATHQSVFERVDDSSGHIQGVYEDGIAPIGDIAMRLGPEAARLLPDKIMERLGDMEHGYLPRVADQVISHLPPEALIAWEADLARRCAERHAVEAGLRASGRWFSSMTDQWRQIRQSIARAHGDLDHLIAIEREKPERSQDTIRIATLLREVGRIGEALDWVRIGGPPSHTFRFDLDDGEVDSPAVRQALLEAAIQQDLGREVEARALLWVRFTQTLAPAILRAHLRALPDFEDMEAEERAMAIALGHADAKPALQFFLSWPRHDLAARLIVERRDIWSGSDWQVLPSVAETLQHDHPLAATILYRILLDDILARARSKAYGHAAKYLHTLDRLAPDSDTAPTRPESLDIHANYRAHLKAQHGRKSGFWALVEGRVSRDEPDDRAGRRPSWRQV